jgi:hypothetical protein
MNYQELGILALEIIETDINIKFQSNWEVYQNKCQAILIIDTERFFFVDNKKAQEYHEEVFALKEDAGKDLAIIFYDTVTPAEAIGQDCFILTDNQEQFTVVTIDGKVIKDGLFPCQNHIKTAITNHKVGKSLNGQHQEKFNKFKELIATTFIKTTDNLIYELLSKGNRINSLYFEESYNAPAIIGYKEYMDKHDPMLIQSFKLIKEKGEDPLKYSFIDLTAFFYRDKLYKETTTKFNEIKELWNELIDFALAAKNN